MQTSDSFKKEILELEKKYWTSMRDHDLQGALRLTDFPCLIAGSHGVQLVEKEQYIEMFKANQEMTREFKIDESKTSVRQIGPNMAVIAYNLHTQLGDKEMDVVDTSTWIKKDGRWLCSVHTETELAH